MCTDFYHWETDGKTGFRKIILHIENSIEKEIDKFSNWSGDYKTCSKCKQNLPSCTYFFMSGGRNGLHYQCKECERGKGYGWGRKYNYYLNDVGKHYCSRCDRILELNPIYFMKSKGKNNRTGYSSTCKECSVENMGFGIYRLNNCDDIKVNARYKICSKCYCELPGNDEYFFKKSDRRNGSVVCKKCKGFDYGVERINLVYKDKVDDTQRFCATCKELKNTDEMSDNSYCKDCKSKRLRIRYIKDPRIKERSRLNSQRRRNDRKNLINDLTIDEYRDTLKYFDECCAYCGISNEQHKKDYGRVLAQDHVIPMVKGGGYTKSNIIPACHHCNTSKGSKYLLEFFEYKEQFTEERLFKIEKFLNTNKYNYKGYRFYK